MGSLARYAEAKRSGLRRKSRLANSERWGWLLAIVLATSFLIYVLAKRPPEFLNVVKESSLLGTYEETVQRVIRSFYDEPLAPGQRRTLCVTMGGKKRCEELTRDIPLD